MKQSEKLSILSTFIFGFLAGMYFYVTGFVFITDPTPVPTQEQAESLVIVGEAYGGCALGGNCPSFRVASDGAYRYLYTPTAGEEQIVRDGRLPAALRRELSAVVVERSLEAQSRPIEPAICNSFTDGIDVRYEITLEGEDYELDSCGTNIDGEGELWTTLSKIWNYFETGEI